MVSSTDEQSRGLAKFFEALSSGRMREPGLGLLLAIQATFMFVVVPLAATGVEHMRLLDLFQFLLAIVTAAAVAESVMARILILGSFALTQVISAVSFNTVVPSATLMGHFGFNAIVTWVIAASVFRAENITHHRILGAAVVYLNLGWLFGTIYGESANLIPGAFSNISGNAGARLGQTLYFSFSTLTTSGFGDILPLHPAVRSLANLEAIVGQFFLAVLVSRLVGLHIAQKVNGGSAPS